MTAYLAFALLPVGWIACLWLARELAARGHIAKDWPLSWELACVAWGLLATLIVELSSVFHRFNAATVGGAWVLTDLFLLATAITLARRRSALSVEDWRHWIRAARGDACAAWPLDARLYLGFTVLLAAFLLGLAVTLPTTNSDSLAYHLPRVLHWIQQQSDHFPTSNTRQIEYGPWSGFVVANIFLLSGRDHIMRSGCRSIGLKFPFHEPEYPPWMMLRNRAFTGEVRHFYVENESARLQTEPWKPDVIVTTRGKPPESVRVRYPFLKDYGELLVISTSDLSPSQGAALHERRE
jgi:hypothetical protein